MKMIFDLSEIISKYNLEKHPEGGYYKETFRSDVFLNTDTDEVLNSKNRCCSTHIYYCVPFNELSKLHRIKSSETWHFYFGEPFKLYYFDDNLNIFSVELGNENQDQTILFTIDKNTWFCGEPIRNTSYSFMGCSVSPGFEFEDLEWPDEALKLLLIEKYGTFINKFI
jgi:predicted cupin superfamily sugar epimerase